MVAVTLGAVVGTGIVLALVADWFTHPDPELRPAEVVEQVDEAR